MNSKKLIKIISEELSKLKKRNLKETTPQLDEAPNCYFRRRNYANAGFTCVARKCGFNATPKAFYPGTFNSMDECNGSSIPGGTGGPGFPGNTNMAMNKRVSMGGTVKRPPYGGGTGPVDGGEMPKMG